MLYNRTDLYSTVTLNNNQELDWISVNFSEFTYTSSATALVTQDKAGRLDLLANDYYGNPAYWFLIALANNIIDIEAQVVTGTQLVMPAIGDWYNFYQQNVKTDSINPLNATSSTALV